jgi:hypothetical protein
MSLQAAGSVWRSPAVDSGKQAQLWLCAEKMAKSVRRWLRQDRKPKPHQHNDEPGFIDSGNDYFLDHNARCSRLY